MTDYHYLIIGGGMTAAAALGGIREVDPTGSIGMISTSQTLPMTVLLFRNRCGRASPWTRFGARRRIKAWGCTWVTR